MTALAVGAIGDLLAAIAATGASVGEALGLAAQGHGEAALRPWVGEAVAGLVGSGVVDVLDDLAAAAPTLAQAGLLAWGTGRLVEGNLDLGLRRWVKTLPEGMRVRGKLGLVGAPLTRLPARLVVESLLDLRRSRVANLPTDLVVGGSLRLGGAPVAAVPEGLRVGGGLDLSGTPILALPKALRVQGSLNLRGSGLRHLPEGLFVGEALGLEGCAGWTGRIPAGAWVGGQVYSDRHPKGVGLDEWRRLHPAGERP